MKFICRKETGVIGLMIQKQSDANAVLMSKLVKKELALSEKTYENVGLKFSISSDTSDFTLEAANLS